MGPNLHRCLADAVRSIDRTARQSRSSVAGVSNRATKHRPLGEYAEHGVRHCENGQILCQTNSGNLSANDSSTIHSASCRWGVSHGCDLNRCPGLTALLSPSKSRGDFTSIAPWVRSKDSKVVVRRDGFRLLTSSDSQRLQFRKLTKRCNRGGIPSTHLR